MKDEKEKNPSSETLQDATREWIAPEFTVLSAGATAGGPKLNTSEIFMYHS
jgi:hypothetical protein